MIQTKPLTGQCPHCGATAENLGYHSRYTLKNGQPVYVIRCKQHQGTFCDRYGTAFYDLKTPEEKVQPAINQGLEGLCPEAMARLENVHPTTVQRWVDRACERAKAADKKLITGVTTENVELDELHSFAGAKHPDQQEDDLDQIGPHWTHCAMARDSRLLLEVIVGPRTEESAMDLVEGVAQRLTAGCWPLWSSDGWAPYVMALTVIFGVLIHFIRSKRPGRPKESEVVPDPRLRYGQVVKQRKGRRPACSDQRCDLRCRRVDPAQANLNITAGTIERDDPPARCAVASQDSELRQVSDVARYADTTVQELLQPVPETRYIEGQNTSASRGLD